MQHIRKYFCIWRFIFVTLNAISELTVLQISPSRIELFGFALLWKGAHACTLKQQQQPRCALGWANYRAHNGFISFHSHEIHLELLCVLCAAFQHLPSMPIADVCIMWDFGLLIMNLIALYFSRQFQRFHCSVDQFFSFINCCARLLIEPSIQFAYLMM